MSFKKALQTVETLTNKENRTKNEAVRLATAENKVENRSLSKVYKEVTNSQYCAEILGTYAVPTFAEFAAKIKPKQFYSIYEGFLCLAKFNLSEVAKNKAKKQDVKAAEVVK